MCPACLATAALAVAGVTSTGGLAALAVRKRRARSGAKRSNPETGTKEINMNLPKVVSRDEWLTARKELLAKEKAFTRERDALNTERRRLPMVKVG
jgi:hypothetical protein